MSPLTSIDHNALRESRSQYEAAKHSTSFTKTRPRSGQMNLRLDEEKGVENTPVHASDYEGVPSTPTITESEAGPSPPASESSRADVSTSAELASSAQKLARRSQLATLASTSRMSDTESQGSSRGPRKLSLLTTKGSVLNMPPPSSVGSPAPTPPASASASAMRAARAGRRLSLAYMPNVEKRNASRPETPIEERNLILPIPSPKLANGATPSHNNDMLRPFAMSRSTSTSSRLSDAAAAPQETVVARKFNEGDTIVTQHRDVLERIAEKERRIFELKEQLTREETELRNLRKLWQTSAHREMAGEGNSATAAGDVSSNGDSVLPADIDAAEALRVLSARVQTGLGSFFEQLNQGETSQPSTAEERKSTRTASSSSTSASLTSVVEESSTAATSVDMSHSADVKAAPARSATTTASKRQSMLGSTGGWSGWQKHLKDARENASSFLAIAEAKIGQAMAVDEASMQRDAALAAVTQNAAANTVPSSTFESANDREKAALAELSWLNSLMGVQTDGSVDRAVALKQPSVDGEQEKALPTPSGENADPMTAHSPSDESTASTRLSKVSSSGRLSASSASNSHDQSFSGRPSSHMSKRVSGLFTALSSMWEAEAEQHQHEQAIAENAKSTSPTTGSQHRTRVAARAAVEQDNKALPSAPSS